VRCRDGGLNGADHLRELRDLVSQALVEAGRPAEPVMHERLDLDQGQGLLAAVFSSVVRHDFTAGLLLPGPEPVRDYVRSMIVTQDQPELESFAAGVASRIPAGPGAVFRVKTRSGCLVAS
jgi:hypothetical protein